MNFKEIAVKRESCRSYSDKAVDRAEIIDILETVRLCPSACNSQPWKFIVCDGDSAKKLADAIINPLLPINKWTKEVPAFIVICETKAKLMGNLPVGTQHYAQMDLGIAASTLCYAAIDKGLSTCIVGAFNEKKVKELLNVPSSINVKLIVTLGYSKEETLRDKKRKSFEEIVSFGDFH